MDIHRRGLMMVLSSPSGAGKTTITRRILGRDPQVRLSISVTTRPRRASETDGVDYHFISKAKFDRMAADGALLEHAQVFGNRYGTPKAPVEEMLKQGQDVLFDIDWQGTQQLAEKVRQDLVSVFVLPPSTAELERRLRTRAQDSEDEVRRRMAKATDEMSHWAEYDYVVVNYQLDQTVARVESILTAERLKRTRQVGLGDFVRKLRQGA